MNFSYTTQEIPLLESSFTPQVVKSIVHCLVNNTEVGILMTLTL